MEKTATKEQIRRARRLLGLTQQKMADELGVSLRTYQRYEDGALPVPQKICDLLRYKMAAPRVAASKKRTKPITRRINTAKNPELKKDILLDWATNWAMEHREIVNDIDRANDDDDYNTLRKKIGELREMSERKFPALIRVIDENFFRACPPEYDAEGESARAPSQPHGDDEWQNHSARTDT